MGKRSLASLGALAVTMLIAGCSGPSDSEPTPTVSETEEASTFIEEMRSTEAFFGFPDEQLYDIADSVCAALADGSTFDDLVRLLAINDIDEDQASTVIHASARETCPEQAE